ncbi:GTPase-activating protein Gyp6p [[Candida] anglica]|uniref:GTPase-activating protein Gyp6p n=1 Tax=[Candida] anglica TaxID=148631 RepID=A0ABP0EH71_9ASCO
MLRENEIISKVLLTVDQYKGKVSSLRTGISNDTYLRSENFSRLLLWKVCLITDSLNIQKWDEALSASRIVYTQILKRPDMAIPWDQLEPDNVFYIPRKTTRRETNTIKKVINNLERVHIDDDPLTADNNKQGNHSNIHLPTDLELLEIITLDIERIFPGNELFHAPTTDALNHRRTLVQILYIWSKCNPSVGYKQGLHELLGLVYLNLWRESIEIPNTNTISTDDLKILKLYNVKYLAHDLFSMFNKFVMQSGIGPKYFESEQELFKSIQTFDMYLLKVDQLIHYNLTNKLKLESPLWLIRYLRLLLSRELGNDLECVSIFWDKLIGGNCSTTSSNTSGITIGNIGIGGDKPNGNTITTIPDLLTFSVIILLIHIKTDLITSDFSEALSLLLHYPIAKISGKYSSKADFISKLYKDAVSLYERRDNDKKLYEYGLKLNTHYNPNLKITMSYRSSEEVERSKEEKLKFEKLRMEMRLKKKVKSMMG